MASISEQLLRQTHRFDIDPLKRRVTMPGVFKFHVRKQPTHWRLHRGLFLSVHRAACAVISITLPIIQALLAIADSLL